VSGVVSAEPETGMEATMVPSNPNEKMKWKIKTTLINSGLLTYQGIERSGLGRLVVPNNEARLGLRWLMVSDFVHSPTDLADHSTRVVEALNSENLGVVIGIFDGILVLLDSLRPASEKDYQLLLSSYLLMCVMPHYTYDTQEARGVGILDCVLRPRNADAPSYILELKFQETRKELAPTPQLLDKALGGLRQIHDKAYTRAVEDPSRRCIVAGISFERTESLAVYRTLAQHPYRRLPPVEYEDKEFVVKASWASSFVCKVFQVDSAFVLEKIHSEREKEQERMLAKRQRSE